MVTRDNPNAYKALFEAANKALNYVDDKEKISNLDDYFQCLEELQHYQDTHPNEDPVFLVLPADEETFDIDANTRKINIPKSFMGGVSVQGDEIAEIIYFSIDRYFDTTDLAGKDILVQWQNAKGESGLCATYNKCLTIHPGKLVFGWPISSDITKQAGNVNFAVRFYERKQKEDGSYYLSYSFSTLNATVKINPALDLEMIDAIDFDTLKDHSALINSRVKSSPASNIKTPAAEPKFNMDLLKEVTFDGESKDLVVQANIPKEVSIGVGSEIRYRWLISTTESASVATEQSGTDTYILTQDSARQGNDVYYIYEKENPDDLESKPVYKLYTNKDPQDFITQKNAGKLYEKTSTFSATGPGSYQAVARNTFGKGNFKETKSTICKIPFPVEPTFGKLSIESYIIGETLEAPTYTVTSEDNGTLTYQWLNGENPVEGQTSNSITIETPGNYYLRATNHKNNADKTAISELCVRATNPAESFDLTLMADGQAVAEEDLSISVQKEISVTLSEVPSDRYKCQWYTKDLNVETPIPGATELTLNKKTPGTEVLVKVINIFNGDTAESESRSFLLRQ